MFMILAIAAAVILIIPAFCSVNAQQIVNIQSAALQFTEGEVLLDGKQVELHDGIPILVENGRPYPRLSKDRTVSIPKRSIPM